MPKSQDKPVTYSVPLEPLNSHDEQPFKLVVASDGLPMIFSLGSDGNLYFTTTENNSQVLWVNHSLTNSPLTSGIGTAFDLYQDQRSQQFVLFLATFGADKTSHLYQTQQLSPDFNGTIDSDFWKELQLSDSARRFQISRIYASASTIVISTLDKDRIKDAQVYHVNTGSCQLVDLPFDASQIIDIKNGYVKRRSLTAGSFIFYKAGGDTPQIIFQPFPQQAFSDPSTYLLSSEFLKTATSIAVLTPADPVQGSLLYVAGNTIFECSFFSADACHQIVPVTQGVLYHSLAVVGDSQAKSLYMLQQLPDNSRVLASINSNEQQTWSLPVALSVNAALSAAISKFASTLEQDAETKQFTDHIVLIDKSNKIQHLTQGTTEQWIVTPILLPSLITPVLIDKIRETVNFTASRATFLQELRNCYEQLATRLAHDKTADKVGKIGTAISAVASLVGIFFPPAGIAALALSLASTGISMGAVLDQMIKIDEIMAQFGQKLEEDNKVCTLLNIALSFLVTYKGQLDPLLSTLFEVINAEVSVYQPLTVDPQGTDTLTTQQVGAKYASRAVNLPLMAISALRVAGGEIELTPLISEETAVAAKTSLSFGELSTVDSLVLAESEEAAAFLSMTKSVIASRVLGGLIAPIVLAISVIDIINTWNISNPPPQVMEKTIDFLDKCQKESEKFCETSQFSNFNILFDNLVKFDQGAGLKIDDTIARINHRVLESLKRKEEERNKERTEECTYMAVLYESLPS